MSSKAVESEAGAAKGGKRKLLMLAAPVVLAVIGAGLWFSGIVPKLLGKGRTSTPPPKARPPRRMRRSSSTCRRSSPT
ncbi:hypothetical protein [Dankookia sp. P2]|uniref:hypothetical protein n=1 Tax=Dankookia sp. P2 TaxID=3423955 RepID=UPI003D67B160